MEKKALMELKKVSGGSFNAYLEKIARIERIYKSVRSAEDLINIFIKGKAKSHNSYLTYCSAIKSFFVFVNRKFPRDIVPADIEAYFDYLCEVRVCVGRKKDIDDVLDRRKSDRCIRCQTPKVGNVNNQVESKQCRFGVPLSKETIRLRISALRTLFGEIQKMDPLLQNPFEVMDEKLKKN